MGISFPHRKKKRSTFEETFQSNKRSMFLNKGLNQRNFNQGLLKERNIRSVDVIMSCGMTHVHIWVYIPRKFYVSSGGREGRPSSFGTLQIFLPPHSRWSFPPKNLRGGEMAIEDVQEDRLWRMPKTKENHTTWNVLRSQRIVALSWALWMIAPSLPTAKNESDCEWFHWGLHMSVPKPPHLF